MILHFVHPAVVDFSALVVAGLKMLQGRSSQVEASCLACTLGELYQTQPKPWLLAAELQFQRRRLDLPFPSEAQRRLGTALQVTTMAELGLCSLRRTPSTDVRAA